MTAPLIAQLVIALGPTALELIPKLMAVWQKPALTEAEVLELCKVSRKPYEAYDPDFKG